MLILVKELQKGERELEMARVRAQRERERLEKVIEPQIKMVQQQVEFFKIECDKANDTIKEAYRALLSPPDKCLIDQLALISNPPPVIVRITNTFLQLVTRQQGSPSWSTLQK